MKAIPKIPWTHGYMPVPVPQAIPAFATAPIAIHLLPFAPSGWKQAQAPFGKPIFPPPRWNTLAPGWKTVGWNKLGLNKPGWNTPGWNTPGWNNWNGPKPKETKYKNVELSTEKPEEKDADIYNQSADLHGGEKSAKDSSDVYPSNSSPSVEVAEEEVEVKPPSGEAYPLIIADSSKEGKRSEVYPSEDNTSGSGEVSEAGATSEETAEEDNGNKKEANNELNGYRSLMLMPQEIPALPPAPYQVATLPFLTSPLAPGGWNLSPTPYFTREDLLGRLTFTPPRKFHQNSGWKAPVPELKNAGWTPAPVQKVVKETSRQPVEAEEVVEAKPPIGEDSSKEGSSEVHSSAEKTSVPTEVFGTGTTSDGEGPQETLPTEKTSVSAEVSGTGTTSDGEGPQVTLPTEESSGNETGANDESENKAISSKEEGSTGVHSVRFINNQRPLTIWTLEWTYYFLFFRFLFGPRLY